MEQSCYRFTLYPERLAFEAVFDTWKKTSKKEKDTMSKEHTTSFSRENNLTCSIRKLGVVKQLVKTMDTNKPAFAYLRTKFPRLSEEKIKEKIFMGLQIRDIFKDLKFENLLNYDEKQVWGSVCQVCTNFHADLFPANYGKFSDEHCEFPSGYACD